MQINVFVTIHLHLIVFQRVACGIFLSPIQKRKKVTLN